MGIRIHHRPCIVIFKSVIRYSREWQFVKAVCSVQPWVYFQFYVGCAPSVLVYNQHFCCIRVWVVYPAAYHLRQGRVIPVCFHPCVHAVSYYMCVYFVFLRIRERLDNARHSRLLSCCDRYKVAETAEWFSLHTCHIQTVVVWVHFLRHHSCPSVIIIRL